MKKTDAKSKAKKGSKPAAKVGLALTGPELLTAVELDDVSGASVVGTSRVCFGVGTTARC